MHELDGRKCEDSGVAGLGLDVRNGRGILESCSHPVCMVLLASWDYTKPCLMRNDRSFKSGCRVVKKQSAVLAVSRNQKLELDPGWGLSDESSQS